MDKKILMVDDEPHIRALLEQTLEDFEDEDVEILTATNGQEGLEIIEEAAKRDHIKGILAQKPLAMNTEEGRKAVDCCEKAGVKLAVNSNMRYDQSIRALKTPKPKRYIASVRSAAFCACSNCRTAGSRP